MPFTISTTNSGNTAGTANVSITVSPEDALFSETSLIPGESIGSPSLEVSNDGDADAYYFIFADWKAEGDTSAVQAQILADRLNIAIEDDAAAEIYNGSVAGLYEQPATGRLLDATANEEITFVVSLPQDVGNLVQDMEISVDLVFVSQASPIS
ncbi:conserved hypothetical protein [Alkaliphilus metalliredigens QYMF]|uniref:Uncharacterized protein n=1 Tax=Alkaliphilus metalliredigens (strain QYMF) TaxID=293826 RepID=A6TTR1_ALKMQ|nr:hypothetical protein [Alkaliphilus metalliredigens]ABR49579.1 conserved hypothetical protein [Alkaliphilus metalliredigens QYMF]